MFELSHYGCLLKELDSVLCTSIRLQCFHSYLHWHIQSLLPSSLLNGTKLSWAKVFPNPVIVNIILKQCMFKQATLLTQYWLQKWLVCLASWTQSRWQLHFWQDCDKELLHQTWFLFSPIIHDIIQPHMYIYPALSYPASIIIVLTLKKMLF